MVERFLTPEEVADKLVVSPRSVRRWLREGRLKGIKVGRLWRIRERDLEVFLDPVHQALENAPEDDEPLDEEEKEAIRKAEEAIAQGRVKPWSQVKKELGL